MSEVHTKPGIVCVSTSSSGKKKQKTKTLKTQDIRKEYSKGYSPWRSC